MKEDYFYIQTRQNGQAAVGFTQVPLTAVMQPARGHLHLALFSDGLSFALPGCAAATKSLSPRSMTTINNAVTPMLNVRNQRVSLCCMLIKLAYPRFSKSEATCLQYHRPGPRKEIVIVFAAVARTATENSPL